MIYRFTVVTSKRDIVRQAVDRFFQEYLITESDSYKDNVKRMALVVEIEGKQDGSDTSLAYNTANKMVEVVGVPVSLQIIDRCPIHATLDNPAKITQATEKESV